MDIKYENEQEVKVLNTSHDDVKERLLELGAIFLGKEWQKNTVYIPKQGSFPPGDYLRIREISKGNQKELQLTYKQKQSNAEFRESNEFTVRFDDFDSMEQLLNLLGYIPVSRGTKLRISYVYQNCRLDFDHWQEEEYPNPYLEIESQSAYLRDKVIEDLGLKDKTISLLSIEELKKKLI